MKKKITMLFAALLACVGVMKADVPFKTSTAPSGTTWDANTTWYFIQFPNSDAYHTGGYLAAEGDGFLSSSGYYQNVSNGYLLLTQTEKPIKNSALWCIVGDEENGFKFYNKMNPALVLGMDASNKARMYLASETKDGVSYAFDYAASTNTKEGLENCATFRIHGSETKYWNNQDAGGAAADYLTIWNSSNAQKDNGSAVRLTEVTEYELAEMAVTLPEVSTESSKQYYLLRNMRSGKYATYTGDATQLQNNDKTLEDNQMWYFTTDGEGYKLNNRATENKYAGTSSFTAEGVTVYVKVNPYCADYLCVSTSSTLASDCWDDQGSNIGTWQPDATDFEGTSWILEPLDYSAELNDLISTIEDAGIVSGSNPGEYTADAVESLNAALDVARAVESATKQDVANLQNVYANLAVNPISAGKYFIVNAKPAFNNNKVLTTYGVCGWYGTASTPAWTEKNTNDPLQYFEIEVSGETYSLKSAYEGSYVTSVNTLGDEPADVTFTWKGPGQYNITINGGVFHANLHGYTHTSNIVGYGGEADTPSAWKLVAVTEEPTFTHTLTVGDAEWSTIVLGYNATIPTADGFKVYTIASQEDGYVMLEEVTGVLGANVPVLVNAPAGEYVFNSTTAAATVTESGLAGTLYNKNITAEAYVLANGTNGVGLYKAQLTDGAFLNNANKAYYVPVNGNAPAMFSFGRGEGTTGIETTVSGEQTIVIYDLAGRRVEKMEKGIYIVNGKKVVR